MELKITNWKYKNLTIYCNDIGNFYIGFQGEIYPINFMDLPLSIQYNENSPVKDYSIHGKIGVDQD